jgi:hypothetical protein
MSSLKNLFGPSKDELWQQLCAEIGADFIEGRLWKGSKVQAHVKSWTITLDTLTISSGDASTGTFTNVTYTRMRAPYINRDGFRFKIYQQGFFSGLGKLLGMEDIEVGDPEFDDRYIIQGNNLGKVQLLFANPTIRQLIQAQPSMNLEVKDDEGWFGTHFPEGVDELYFTVVGTVKDIERLKLLYELFAKILNCLCHIGSAYDEDPGVELN